jgi:hypothetical protein
MKISSNADPFLSAQLIQYVAPRCRPRRFHGHWFAQVLANPHPSLFMIVGYQDFDTV